LAITIVGLLTQSYGQGTMTITFDTGYPVAPPGSMIPSAYDESGVHFWNPYGEQSTILVGPGIVGYPQDGTAYLQVPPSADLSFSFNTSFQTYFNFVSFDAAGYSTSLPGATLEVIGYKGMSGTVTNYFTVDSLTDRRANNLPDFETFSLSSQFQNVYQVDVLTSGWSLDNVVLSGVPEPSCSALVALATLCGLGRAWMRGRRTQ